LVRVLGSRRTTHFPVLIILAIVSEHEFIFLSLPFLFPIFLRLLPLHLLFQCLPQFLLLPLSPHYLLQIHFLVAPVHHHLTAAVLAHNGWRRVLFRLSKVLIDIRELLLLLKVAFISFWFQSKCCFLMQSAWHFFHVFYLRQ